MDTFHQILEVTALIISIIGVPTAIYIYLTEQKLNREEREYGTYDSLDDKYIEFQQLCLEYPNLDVFDTQLSDKKQLSEGEKKQEEAILLIRISIFERAFLMYHKRCKYTARKHQWVGWDIDMKEWLNRKNYKAVWDAHGHYYDKSFVNYLNEYLSSQPMANKSLEPTP